MLGYEPGDIKPSSLPDGGDVGASGAQDDRLLRDALEDEHRRQHGLNILFADEKKRPAVRSWTKWQTTPQTDDHVHCLFREGERRITCWGYVTGFGGLWAIDFDALWVYQLWVRRFGARGKTLTIETPNVGARPYFLCEKPVTNNRFKETLHVELEGLGRFAITDGAIRIADNSMGEYHVAVQEDILRDDRMPVDTIAFLEEVLKRYEFTQWRCIQPHLTRAAFPGMPHEVRRIIANILITKSVVDAEIHDFFRICTDYRRAATQGQIDAQRKAVARGVKPDRCETLRSNLGWAEEDCQGCPRRRPPSARPLEPGKGARKDRESQADAMVKLATAESVALFHDERREPYIRIRRGEVLVTLRLRSKDARTWLSGLLWRDREKAPSSEALSSALNVLEALANDGPEHRLYNRVAPGEDGSIWLDLCDEDWRAVHVTRAGWGVVKHPPILFRRYSHQQPLPTPVQGGSLIPLLDYAHITHLGDQLLYVVTAITYLIPDIPHVVILFFGPQGAGKTWALRVIRIIIDPSQLDLLSPPTRLRELVQVLDHNWCTFFDNVGRLSAWQSNVFCRAVTGAGVSKRRLYTDDEDVIYQYHRCLGLTDLNIAAERGDLLQRSLLLGLDAIPEGLRRTEKELKASLERQHPELLGAMLDVLVEAMNLYPTIRPRSLYRMADYTIWGCAITQALGLDPQHFLDAYEENINAQNLEAVRASPISDALILLMTLNPEGWSGTASQLYSALEEQAKVLKISTRQKAWPKKPHVLSRVLNELAPSLSAVGLEVVRGYRGKTRLIHINTVGSVGSVGELERQADWGRGRDLRNYLSGATAATVASDAIYKSLSGEQPVPTLPSQRPSREEAIHTILEAAGGELGILIFQIQLERRSYSLEGPNDDLSRLEYQGKIIRTPKTIALGPVWRRTPKDEEPLPTSEIPEIPEPVDPSVEVASDEAFEAEARRLLTDEVRRVMPGCTKNIKKVEGDWFKRSVLVESLGVHISQDPEGVVRLLCGDWWRRRSDWWFEEHPMNPGLIKMVTR